MRVYFIRDWDDNGFIHKAGQSPTMWTETALRALRDKAAVMYEERHFIKVEQNEPPTEEKTSRKSKGKAKEAGAEAEKIENK